MQQTNPKDFLDLLEVFRIGLTNGIIDGQKVISWADDLIQQDSEPAYFLIELSLSGSGNTKELISLLNTYLGETKPQISGRVILGYLYHAYGANQVTMQKAVNTVYWLVWEGAFMEEEQSFMYGLEEDYCLAAEGVYGTLAEVESQLLRFLSLYQAFQLENRQEWGKVNESIPSKIQALYQQVKTW